MAQRPVPLRVTVPAPVLPLHRTPRPATRKKGAAGAVRAMFRNVIGDQQLSPHVSNAPNLSALVKSPLQFIMSDAKARKIGMFLLLSTVFMVVEFVYGFHSNSLGLVSDACHMLFDCAALAIGLYASYISKLQANSRFNYGYGRFEVISGYMNAVFLILVASLIVLESLERILDPPEITTESLLAVSIMGFLVNVVGLTFFHEHHHHHHSGGSCGHSHSHSKKDLKSLAGITLRAKGGDYTVLGVEDHHHHEHDHQNSSAQAHHGHVHTTQEHGAGFGHGHLDDVHHGHLDDVHHRHQLGGIHHNHGSPCSHGHDHGHGHDHEYNHDHADHGHDDEVEHDHTDHNMQGMFLHILADTLGSIGVVVSTLLIQYQGWYFADPVCSIFISALIIASVIPLVKGSAEMLLQRMPRSTESRIQRYMKQVEAIDGVWSYQDLHVWNFTNAEIIGSLHVLATRGADREQLRVAVSGVLKKAGITDLSLQFETV
ncbi:hypothetical protein KC19_8G176700 [Ceratodon purpureus]|uniref:Cation efflux protein transmembrane domain-containing protein n=1 Tax=Ceratodon purpureus TaxID=3225 RepID=A0A8T0H3C5_CERPU|nr:hypothetical protein KC19_8G176700 [Ceratodon purpureus]